jgi:selenide,water dikinase
MVDDPYLFGQIAAANALSDIWAMGGEVKFALNILSFPEGEEPSALHEILRGGADKVREAGGVLCGGHSIMGEEVLYGLSVTGTINPEKILRNDGAKPGDVIFLTKPLGVGIIMAAHGKTGEKGDAYRAAVKQMSTLNKAAADIIRTFPGVTACTDVTGFGFLGHLSEMAGGNTTIYADASGVPLLPSVYNFAQSGFITSGSLRNRAYVSDRCESRIQARKPPAA